MGPLGIATLIAWGRRLLGLVSIIPGAGIISAVIDLASSLIRFFSTPFGQKVLLGIVIFLVWFGGDIMGRRSERAYYVAKIAQMQDEAKDRDKTIREAVGAQTDLRIKSIQKAADAANERADQYAMELANRKVGGCAVTPDDLKRLRQF